MAAPASSSSTRGIHSGRGSSPTKADISHTLAAWVFFHAIETAFPTHHMQSSEKTVAAGSIWRCWDPDCGGWEIRAIPQEAGLAFDVEFIRLHDSGNAGKATADKQEASKATSTHVGSIRTGAWFPLILEVRAEADEPDRVVLGQGAWVNVDLGGKQDLSNTMNPGSMTFFTSFQKVEVAALWLFEGSRSDDARRWLESLFKESSGLRSSAPIENNSAKDSANPGRCLAIGYCERWRSMQMSGERSRGMPTRLAASPEIPGKPDMGVVEWRKWEEDLMARTVLGYLPGRKNDLVNARPAGRRRWGFGTQAAFDVPRKVRISRSGPLHWYLTSSGWLVSLLWALARVLPRQGADSDISDEVTGITNIINQTFELLAFTLIWATTCSQGIRFFVDDGGFAVWSYVLWHSVHPRWLDDQTGQIFHNLVRRIAHDHTACRDCLMHLFGPHMGRLWSRTSPSVQRSVWEAVHCVCRHNDSLLQALGDVHALLFTLDDSVDAADAFGLRALLLLENPREHPVSSLWPWFYSAAKLPAQLVRIMITAVLLVVLTAQNLQKDVSTGVASGEQDPMQEAEQAVIGMLELCCHPNVSVRTEALLALWQLEAIGAPMSSEQLQQLKARLTRSVVVNNLQDEQALECTVQLYEVLWPWLQRRVPQFVQWDHTADLKVKLERLRAPVTVEALTLQSDSKRLDFNGVGPLLCVILAVIDNMQDDSLRLRFLHDFRVEIENIKCAGSSLSRWWEKLFLCRDTWHPWLLDCALRHSVDDNSFLAVVKLHTTLVSSVFDVDPDAWQVVDELVLWSKSTRHENTARVHAVARILLVQLLEALHASDACQPPLDAASSSDHQLSINLKRLVPVIHSFMLQGEASSDSHSKPLVTEELRWKDLQDAHGKPRFAFHPHCLRLRSSGRGESIWLDFVLGAQLLRLWEKFLLKDPLEDHPLKDFDLSTWAASSRWHRRPCSCKYPLNGVTEHLLLWSNVQADGAPFLFTYLMHWGTRCLLYRAPTESDTCKVLGIRPSSSTKSNAMSSGTAIGASSLSGDGLSLAAATGEGHMLQMRRDVLRTLRNLALCLLAIGTHGAIPAAAHESANVAVLCFCMHACMHAMRPKEVEESKLLTFEAREAAADIVEIILILCCQSGFNDMEPIRTVWSPIQVKMQIERKDIQSLVSKQAGGAKDAALSVFATSWLAFAMPLDGPRHRPKAGGSGGAHDRKKVKDKKQSEMMESWSRFNKLEKWGFKEAVADSPLAGKTCSFLEAHTNPNWLLCDSSGPSCPNSSDLQNSALHSDADNLPLAQLTEKLQRSARDGRKRFQRLARLQRSRSQRAWRLLCYSNRTPGSVWHRPETWKHPNPPRASRSDDAEVQEQSITNVAEPDLPTYSTSHNGPSKSCIPKPGVHDNTVCCKHCRWWNRSFAGSTVGGACNSSSQRWGVSRHMDHLGQRSLLRKVDSTSFDVSPGAGWCSSSSSTDSGSSSGSCIEDDKPLYETNCTWVRREASRTCRLRIYPSTLELRADLESPPAAQMCCCGVAGLGAGKPARPRRRRCTRRFNLSRLRQDGVQPRRFLHRDTALELLFLDDAAPVRLHFDEEAPMPAKFVHCNVHQGDFASEIGPAPPPPPPENAQRSASAPAGESPNTPKGSCSDNDHGLNTLGITGAISNTGTAAVSLLWKTTSLLSGYSDPEVSRRDEVWVRLHRCLELSSSSNSSTSSVEGFPVWALTAGCHEPSDVAAEIPKHVNWKDVQRVRELQEQKMREHRDRVCQEWKCGEMSNYQYLQELNFLSGRSLEDLSQYPVFPWVLRDWRSTTPPSQMLLCADPEKLQAYFRDLLRTLGDLGDPDRRELLHEKFALGTDLDIAPYHYGTHYSTPAFVMHFLIRLEPFTGLARSLQGGKFDVPDRIFNSLPECWRSCTTEMCDVRELTPELFSLPECLMNIGKLNMGVRQDGAHVNHVELPTWAEDTFHFIHEHRIALESAPISSMLHGWIDLVWGYKQRGPAAEEALNVFFPLTYDHNIDWKKVDPIMRHCQEQQILHFGQTPPQIFKEPHDARKNSVSAIPSLLQVNANQSSGGHPHNKWHSSTLHQLLQSRSLGDHALGAPRGHVPVVSLGSHADRLFVLQADGTMRVFRFCTPWHTKPSVHRMPLLVVRPNVSPSFRLFSYLSNDDVAGGSLEVDVEARQELQESEAPSLWNTFNTDPGVAHSSSCWAFLPEHRFFMHGGCRDGSMMFGRTTDKEATTILQAHAATVSAVAVSKECARCFPDSHGLLCISGSMDGGVSIWAATDDEWQKFVQVARWRTHQSPVRCVDFGTSQRMALSAGDDGFVHLYRLRSVMRPLQTFAFKDRKPVTQARFGCPAPATIVACSTMMSLVCVWSINGFLLATVKIPHVQAIRVIVEDDAHAGVMCACEGTVELRSLPYLYEVWKSKCEANATALDSSPSKGLLWVGLEDGSFEAIYANDPTPQAS